MLLPFISCQILTPGSRLSEVRLVEESQSMKDACKVMLEHIAQDGRVRVGYGSSLLEEARAAGKGKIIGRGENTGLSPTTGVALAH